MFNPIDVPLPCAAPLFAASMIPGPPPVITGTPALANFLLMATAAL